MRLLVFQHIDCEHPGQLRQYLRQGRIEWRTIELDRGEPIPPLDNYDALWVMGGPMDVWDVEENPWLIAEKAAIRRWVRELDRPFLGLCLGHQLLADALGGTRRAEPTHCSPTCQVARRCCNGIPCRCLSRLAMRWFWQVRTPVACKPCTLDVTPGRCSIMSRWNLTPSSTGERFPLIVRRSKQLSVLGLSTG
jgi:hypothetical protein